MTFNVRAQSRGKVWREGVGLYLSILNGVGTAKNQKRRKYLKGNGESEMTGGRYL